jgi:hypothetical protein
VDCYEEANVNIMSTIANVELDEWFYEETIGLAEYLADELGYPKDEMLEYINSYFEKKGK